MKMILKLVAQRFVSDMVFGVRILEHKHPPTHTHTHTHEHTHTQIKRLVNKANVKKGDF